MSIIKYIGSSASSAIIKGGVQLTQIVILARVCSVEDLGVLAIANVLLGFSILFSEMGLSQAIIYEKKLSQDKREELFLITTIIGSIITIFLLLSVEFIASFYSFEGVETILYFVAINVFIRTLISQNYAYIQKYLKFSYLAKIDIIGSIIGGIIFYICIINHIGVESMVIGQIVNSFIVYLGVSFKNNSFFPKTIRPKFKENLPLVKYGLYITAQNLVNYFSSRVDQLIIGKFLGADILGVYSTLKELLSKPVFQFINPMLNRVAFPVLSKSDLDKRITVYSRLNRIMYLISIPCFIVLYIHLDVFIKVALGEKWLSYIDISKYLILMLMIISIGNPVGILIKSFGKVKIGLIWEINVSIIRVLLLFIFVGYGINTLIISQIIYSLLILLFQYFFIVRKIIEYKFIDWLGNITFGLTFSLLIFFIHYVFVNYFNVYMLLLLEGSVFIFMVFTFKNKIKLS